MSLAALRLFAEMFVPRVARAKLKEQKKAAARLSHIFMSVVGSHRVFPYKVSPAAVTAIPMKPARVNAVGMMRI